MSERLDALMERLAASQADHDLTDLESSVGRRIAARRRDLKAAAALTPIRLASVGLALAVGVTAGGAVAGGFARETQSLASYSAGAHLAPSSLLEGD